MELSQHITLETSAIGGKITHDYFAGLDSTKMLYNFTPDIDGLKKAVLERRKFPVNRELLYTVLHKQHGRSFLSEQLKTNLELLLQDNTYTITTGHQLNIFTGPLYFIYKIASAIVLSRKLNEEMPGNNFVPVYWMNSEDHDFAEINHFFLKGEKWVWENEIEKYGPVGKMALTGMNTLLEEIRLRFGDQFKADPIFDFMLRAYSQSNDLAEAHREIVNKLFGEYGLIILDQDDIELKTAFAENMAEEIFSRSSINNIEATNAYLEKNNFKPQVFAREINLFYTGNGYRERIILKGENYSLSDNSKSWTNETMKMELKSNPQYFSPNVVMRPMYQEFVLPNIAYIGGPAEIAYWLQYKTNFASHKIFYPALILRDCFLIVPEKKWRKLKELGFKLEDFFLHLDELLNQYIKDNHKDEMDISSIISGINDQYGHLLRQVVQIDPSMEGMVKAAQQKALNDIERVAQKMNKALKSKNEIQLNLMRNFYQIIFPQGIFQERVNNLFDPTFLAHDFIDQIISCANPLDARLKVLRD